MTITASIHEILRAHQARLRQVFALIVVALFMLLNYLLIQQSMQKAMSQMSAWIAVNKPRLEQALFLESTLSLSGRLAQAPEISEDLEQTRATVFNPQGRALFGDGTFVQSTRNGFDITRLGTRVSYFDRLVFAEKAQGFLAIEAQLRIGEILRSLLLSFSVCGLLLFILNRILSGFLLTIRTRIVTPIKQLSDVMADAYSDSRGASLPAISGAPKEIEQLTAVYRKLISRIDEFSSREAEQAKLAALGAFAAQVAHDVQSPLSALDVLAGTLENLSERQSRILSSSLGRMRAIVSDLVLHHKDRDSTSAALASSANASDLTKEPLSSVIVMIVQEKRAFNRRVPEIACRWAFGESAYGLFLDGNRSELSRVLSNLLDNAIESCVNGGQVRVLLEVDGCFARIKIEDTGCGISAEILPKLMRQGATFGKENGSGLGLYHASRTLEEMGGNVAIESAIGRGTTVTLSVPIVAPPPWFLPSLVLRPGAKLAIVDDDPLVHDRWDDRMAQAGLYSTQLDVRHFMSLNLSDAQRAFLQEASCTVLIDQNFRDTAEKGLDLASMLPDRSSVVLVTSDADKHSVRRRCLDLGIKLLPKDQVALLPIRS